MRTAYIIILGMTLLSVWAIPTYAKETINLDQYSSCSIDGFCKTEVDINELSLSKDGKDLLKSIESDTVYSLEMSHSIESFSIEIIDKEKLYVSGYVTQNTYWTADFGDVFLDPWWNVTGNVSTNTTVNSPALADAGTNSDDYNRRGVMILLDNDTTQLFVKRHDDSTASFVWLFFGNKSSYANATYRNDDYAVFNNTPSGYYYLMNNLTTGSDNMFQLDSGVSYPYENDILHVVLSSTLRAGGTWANYTNYYLEIEQIIAETENEGVDSTWYEIELYLNGTEGNVSINSTDVLNSTATTNLTGLTALIYINDTLSANNTTTATNETLLSDGLWNITAWIGNASTNGTVTWWATVSTPLDSAIAYVYCIDNNTLGHINVTNLQTDSVITYYENCANGCENITASCRLPEYQENLIIFAVFVIIASAGYWFYRRVR